MAKENKNKAELVPWRAGGLFQPFEELDAMVDRFFSGLPRLLDDWPLPSVFGNYATYGMEELKETKENYVLSVPLPGTKKDDIKVSLDDNVLTISASGRYEKEDKKEESGVKYHTRSFSAAGYQRHWRLPEGIGEITSGYKDGILEVTIPKPAETKREVKYIDVKAE